MVLLAVREKESEDFPLQQFVEFLRKFDEKIWKVFKARGIVAENDRFPASFIRPVLHTCIRFFFVQGLSATDPSKLATLPYVTMCDKKLRRHIQFISYITQDQFRRFPDWLMGDANSHRTPPRPRPKSFRSTIGTPKNFLESRKNPYRHRFPTLARAKSQGDYEPMTPIFKQYSSRRPMSRPYMKKFFKRPVGVHSWSSSFRASAEFRKPLPSEGSFRSSHWLKYSDPTLSNDTLDGNDCSFDLDGISALSIISDSESVTSAKSDSAIYRKPATVAPPKPYACHSDESISISRPATRPQSRQVSKSNLVDWADTYMKFGSSDTYESLHQVYKFVSEMEDGLYKQYASILLKNRISWNILSSCEINDLIELEIPRIHARFILSQIRKLIVE